MRVAAAFTFGLAASATKITFREKGSEPGTNDCVLFSDFEDGKRLLKSSCDVQFHDPSLLTEPSSLKDVREQVEKIGFYLPKPQVCPMPTIADDTKVGGQNRGLDAKAIKGHKTGQIGEVKCNEGFKKEEAKLIACYIDGFRAGPFMNNFDGPTGDAIYPQCKPITCPSEKVTVTDNKGASVVLDFPQTENLIINPFGATLTRKCPDTHKGEITRVCEESKDSWTATGTCDEKECPAVSIAVPGTGDTVNFAALLQKNSKTQSCPTGYSGSVTVDCPAHTEFSSTSHNCVRQCVAFGGPNNGNGCPVMADGTSCSQSCNNGYVRNDAGFHASQLSTDQNTRVCQTDGSWSGFAPTCIRRCDSISAGVGFHGIATSYRGQTSQHSCKAGYQGSAVSRTCQADGSWSGAAPSCARICYAIGASNGANGIGQGVQGNSVTHSCAATYSGNSVSRTCGTNGQWSAAAPTCLKICNAIGAATRHTGVGSGVHGNTRSHSCAATYTGSSVSRTCSHGSWTGANPTCSKICGGIGGSTGVNAVGGGVEGNTISQSCTGGFSGSAQSRTCQSNGHWSGQAPSCIKVCNAIGSTTRANGLGASTAGSGAWHSCKGTHSGSQVYRTCGTNGNWNGNSPNCLRTCAALGGGTGYNGVSAGTENDQRSQSCNGGYTGGATTRTCQSNGHWAGSNPSCAQPSGMILQHANMDGFYYNYNWAIEWPYYGGSNQNCADLCFARGYTYCTMLRRSNYGYTGCLMGNNAPLLFHRSQNSYYNHDRSYHWVRRGRRLAEAESAEMLAASGGDAEAPADYDQTNLLSFGDHLKQEAFMIAMEGN